jgi:hypothetical protein
MKKWKMCRKCYRYDRDNNLIDRTSFLVFLFSAVRIVKLRLWILPCRVFCDNGIMYVEIITKVIPYKEHENLDLRTQRQQFKYAVPYSWRWSGRRWPVAGRRSPVAGRRSPVAGRGPCGNCELWGLCWDRFSSRYLVYPPAISFHEPFKVHHWRCLHLENFVK